MSTSAKRLAPHEPTTVGQRLQRAELASDVAQILASEAAFDEKMQAALQRILRAVHADRGSLMLENARGDLVVEASTVPGLVGRVSRADTGGLGHHVLRTGETLVIRDFTADGRFRRRTGMYANGTCMAVPIRDGSGTIGVINVSEKRGGTFTADDEALLHEFVARAGLLISHARMRERLAAQNAELRAAQESKEQLARMLVHDLKGPVTAVLGALELVRRSESLTEDGSELLEASVGSCHTLIQLTSNLLDVAKARRGELRARPVPTQVGSFLAELAPTLRSLGRVWEVGVEVGVGDTERRLGAFDPALVSRVLVNLVLNAVQHSGTTRPVRVSADGLPDGRLCFSVQDHGAGVSAEDRERIFDADVSGAEVGGPNHGLGLTFCKLATEAHGGRLELESEPGRGSVFRMVIPAAGPGQSA